MQLTQATLAMVLAAGVSAIPTGSPSGTCNGGSGTNVCSNNGKCTYKTVQDCTASGGDSYCCTSTGVVNVLNCPTIGPVTVSVLDLKKREANPPPASGGTCNGGSATNYCLNKGVWSAKTAQQCSAEGGSSDCCTSTGIVNLLNCVNAGPIDIGVLSKRTGGTCNGGSATNACLNKGVWSYKTSQQCSAEGGDAGCCSSAGGLINALNCVTVGPVNVGVLKREANPPPASSGTCNGGNAQNACLNQGVWSIKTQQDCTATGGDAYCCKSGGLINAANCVAVGPINVGVL